ncbi:MAG: CapA family protein [Bacillota bacterium]
MGKQARFILAAFIATATLLALAPALLFPRSTPINSSYGTTVLRLAFAGDILTHQEQIDAAYNAEDGSYDFSGCFREIGPLLETVDLAFCDLEVVLAGEETGYTGYPCFNAPESLAAALKEAGFDLVSTVNNHCMDRGEAGVYRTLDHLEEAGLLSFGTYRSRVERDTPLLVTVKGIKMAFLGYTYCTNGIPLPEGRLYIVNMLEEAVILADLAKARQSADLVILYLHWGNEYQRFPSAEQSEMAERFLSAGADMVIGSHPHVVQPVEFFKIVDGKKMLEKPVAYSLGNFISDQRMPFTDTGIILFVDIVSDPATTRLAPGEVSFIPTWVHKHYHQGRLQYRVIPIPQALEKYRQGKDPSLDMGSYEQLQGILRETSEHLQFLPLYQDHAGR